MFRARIDTISHLDVHQTRPFWLNAFLPGKEWLECGGTAYKKCLLGSINTVLCRRYE